MFVKHLLDIHERFKYVQDISQASFVQLGLVMIVVFACNIEEVLINHIICVHSGLILHLVGTFKAILRHP